MELQVTNNFSDITSEILALAKMSEQAGSIAPELYTQYDVKRGLRDLNGKGVLAGLTNISDVRATKIVNGEAVPAHGQLFYRGYNVEDLVRGFSKDNRFGFDEVTYLLLFNKLPNKEELESFSRLLNSYRSLPTSFVRDIIMKAPSKDMMNTLARSVLTLYSYDDRADDVSLPNVSACSSSASARCCPSTATRPTATIMTATACISTSLPRRSPWRKIFYISCALTAVTPLWKQKSSISR